MNPMHLEPRESLKAAMDTPWKAINEIRRLLWTPFIWSYFALHGVAWGSHWSVYGTPLIQRHRGSQIAIGHDFEMRNWFGANIHVVTDKYPGLGAEGGSGHPNPIPDLNLCVG